MTRSYIGFFQNLACSLPTRPTPISCNYLLYFFVKTTYLLSTFIFLLFFFCKHYVFIQILPFPFYSILIPFLLKFSYFLSTPLDLGLHKQVLITFFSSFAFFLKTMNFFNAWIFKLHCWPYLYWARVSMLVELEGDREEERRLGLGVGERWRNLHWYSKMVDQHNSYPYKLTKMCLFSLRNLYISQFPIVNTGKLFRSSLVVLSCYDLM